MECIIKKITALVCAALLFLFAGCENRCETVRGFALDTEISITVDKKERVVAKNALKKCRDYEKIFSRTDKESELYRLNNGEMVKPSEELRRLIESGISFSELSGGAFDITIAPLTDLWNIKERKMPPKEAEIKSVLSRIDYRRIALEPFSLNEAQVDLGALAKGYIADSLRKYFEKHAVNNVIADLGGNVMLMGEYTVGIQSPFDSEKLYAKMRLKDLSAVTSGAYQRYFEYKGIRYHHILDARTGGCAESGVASVTVVSPNSANADALSTIIFILGEQGLKLCKKFEDTDAIIINENGSYVTTEDFKKKYKLEIIS